MGMSNGNLRKISSTELKVEVIRGGKLKAGHGWTASDPGRHLFHHGTAPGA